MRLTARQKHALGWAIWSMLILSPFVAIGCLFGLRTMANVVGFVGLGAGIMSLMGLATWLLVAGEEPRP